MATDHLPIWTPLDLGDLESSYRRHGTVSRWLIAYAPVDVTDQLAIAFDRVHRPVEETPGSVELKVEVELAALAGDQQRHNRWLPANLVEITTWSELEAALHRHAYRLGQAAAYSQPDHVTALLGPLPERIHRGGALASSSRGSRGLRESLKHRSEAPDRSRPVEPRTTGPFRPCGDNGRKRGALRSHRSSHPVTDFLAQRWEGIHAFDEATRTAPISGPPPGLSWPEPPDLGRDVGHGVAVLNTTVAFRN